MGYSRIVSEALEYSTDDGSPTAALQSLIVADVSQFIDTMERLRKIVLRLPGNLAVRVAKKAFDSELAPFKKARNFFEHIDTSITTIAETGHGAFGSVTWWTAPSTDGSGMTFALLPGTLKEGKGQLQAVVSTHIRPPLDRLMAVVGGQPV